MKKIGVAIVFIILAIIISCTMVHYVNAPDAPDVKNETQKDTELEAKTHTYVNENLGYSLEIPESWDGYYKIHEEYGNISVSYYGDTEKSKGEDDKGITMFFIVDEHTAENEKGFLDSITDVGVARGINYFYATTTDFSLGALYDASENDNDDWDRAHQMMDDIPDILKSFKETE